MYKISFNDSFRPKGVFSKIAENKFESEGFIKSTKKGKIKKGFQEQTPSIQLLSHDVRKSKKLHEYSFTNFLHNSTDQEVKSCVFDIIDNPSIIDTPNASEVTINEKINECLKLYINPIPVGALIIKSNLVDALGVNRPVRVYSIMEFKTDNGSFKAESRIVLIDPFHLVIPSQHKGKPKDVVEREVYAANQNNQLCINDYVNQIRGF